VPAWLFICLERGADLHIAQLMPLPFTVSCFSKIQIGFTFLVPLTWVVPEKGPLNGCVCVCVYVRVRACVRACVQIEKKKGKYGIEYSLASASDGPCHHDWGHAENRVPSPQLFHFSNLGPSVASFTRFVVCC